MFFKLLGASSLLMFYGSVGVFYSATPTVAQDIQNAESRIISASKTLSIKVLNEESLSGTYTTNQNDEITLPLIGTLSIKGQTPSQIESLLTQRYSDGYLIDPTIIVSILENQKPETRPPTTEIQKAHGGIYILGSVKNPGRYDLLTDAHNILNIIALAGGYTGRADKKTFEIMRDNEKLAVSAENYHPTAGDIIIVKERFFWAGNR